MIPALDCIIKDLEWRQGEIAGMRIILSSLSISDGQRKALLRAAWAMLYAHYEGFCKEALTAYFNVIENSGATNSVLPEKTKIHALSHHLKKARTMGDEELLGEIFVFSSKYIDSRPKFPDVDTQSNLWPNVLKGLLELADLSAKKVDEHSAKLKTLVARRNQIAHGKDNFIEDIKYYLTFESAVYDVMYDLTEQIDKRIGLPPYSIKP
jgi:hypothetical protein